MRLLLSGFLGLCLFSFPAFAGAWDDAYKDGMAHLRAGDTGAALAAFETALKAEPTAMQRANTLYLMAATHFQMKDYKAAAGLLDQVIALHDKGAFDDRDFLRAVLLRAAMVAHALKDDARVQAFQARVADMDAHNPDIWEIDDKTDSYRHRHTGLVYPAKVAGFARRSIAVFRPDGTDVGGDYHLDLDGGGVDITLYATENYPLTAQQHLHSAIQSIRADMNLPEKAGEGSFAPWGASGPQGVFQLYRASGAAAPVESGLYVVARDTTHFTLRVSFPAAIAGPATGAIDRFIAALDWPKP